MSDCIFCKLANGEIPTDKLYEDDDFAVILDAGPAAKGHSLIIPKAHYANITEMPDDLLMKAAVVAKKTGSRLIKAMNADGLNVLQNNGTAAGQSVFHFHIHMIPRKDGERPIVANWIPGSVTVDDRAEILTAFWEG
ncbi:MAG: HIT family protein [Lachnospiraceae bacterium]|nr:HIT family protein [Lachnospiraceae bacterium]